MHARSYFTFGDASWGTVKLGRDIGLFGKDAILDDMTLLGVGTASGNAAPSNTSLGRIGIGYIYTDWEPQITYTTPTFGGFTRIRRRVSAPGSSGRNGLCIAQRTADPSRSFLCVWRSEGRRMTGKVWVDVVSQNLKLDSSMVRCPARHSQTTPATAVDGGVKIGVAGFEGVLYGYTGKGVGTTGLYYLATSALGDKRKSDGGYIQATYKMDKLKLGVSYGISDLKLADDERATESFNDLVKRNKSAVVGVYYSLTKSVTLVGEFIDTKAEAWNGNSATQKDIALGGILFF